MFLLPLENDHTESPRGIEFSDPFVVSFPLSVRKESEREFRALRRRSQFTMFLFDLSLSLPYLPPRLERRLFFVVLTEIFFLSWGKYIYILFLYKTGVRLGSRTTKTLFRGRGPIYG